MTTAKTTAFTYETIEVAGFTFAFDGNQKITAANGSFDEPAANAFSTWQSKDCPFRTPTCDSSCYVHNLEKYQPEVHDFYKMNSENIHAVMSAYEDNDVSLYIAVVSAFGEWIEKNCAGGFRWHVSGDVFSETYADFIVDVCQESPNVNHWIYTRSFPYVGRLRRANNLVINLSADKDNYWLARRFADEHDLRVCYLTVDGEIPEDLKDGDVIFPDYALRGVDKKPFEFRNDSEWWQGLLGRNKKMVCPTDAYGKSEKIRCGPCNRCMV